MIEVWFYPVLQMAVFFWFVHNSLVVGKCSVNAFLILKCHKDGAWSDQSSEISILEHVNIIL